jgi:hypothetical protein
MKRMKALVECEFEFPDDYVIAPDLDGTPALKIGKRIFVPTVRWNEQTFFLDGSFHGFNETEPAQGFQPVEWKIEEELIHQYLTVEDGHVEMAADQSPEGENEPSGR